MDCHTCGERVPASVRYCPSCQSDVGFPNVRASELPEEKAALRQRLTDARTSTRARKCEAVLDDFGRAVLQSRAVICRSIGILSSLVASDNVMYGNYYKQIEGDARLPEDNAFDRGRPAVDGTLFPNYHKDMYFAALSLDKIGLTSYGEYSIVLKEKMISGRASVFEENGFHFCPKHRIVVGDPIPPGYRAIWIDRNELGMAKLHSKIESSTRPNQYPGILLSQGANPKDADFIEVHIWGPIHRSAIELVVGPKPKRREDIALWNSVRTKLTEVGATLEIG